MTFGPQNTFDLARQAPCTYMEHVFFGTSWAPDARIEDLEHHAWWNRFDDRAANVHEAPWICNGEYELSFGEDVENVDIRIHTVQSGNLRGRRVVRFFKNGRWQTFATLRRNGTIFVWSAFRGEEHRAMVIAANFGLSNIASEMRGQLTAHRHNDFSRWTRNVYTHSSQHDEQGNLVMMIQHEWRRACQVCNSESVRVGLCAAHVGSPDEPVPPHAGTFRAIGPTDYLLSQNGTGYVR